MSLIILILFLLAFKIQDADDESAAIAVKNQIEAEATMQTEELKKVPKLLEADDMIEDKDEEEGENFFKQKLLKYQFCNKYFQYVCNFVQLNTCWTLLWHFFIKIRFSYNQNIGND